MKLNQPSHKHKHLQAAQSHRTNQSLQNSVLLANAQPSDNQSDRKNAQLPIAPTKKWPFSASYDSLVVQQTFVLHMHLW